MTNVRLDGLTKRYRDVVAVDRLTLDVSSGELLAVVGPTGSGKTTLLRLIAGLTEPSEGSVLFDGKTVNDLPTNERGVRMVFQDYALYPHLKVFSDRRYSNLGFPLNLRRTKPGPLRSIVDGIAARIGISERLYPRRPGQLSEGEKQRVAFGRAVALPPRLLLLDEPFSNLDPIRRATARNDLRARHDEDRITTIYVTHNLGDAFAIADRVAVMSEGRIVQVGTPDEVRERPANELVRALIESQWIYNEL
jgi:ABC-type sugar transport system ATPase subunit